MFRQKQETLVRVCVQALALFWATYKRLLFIVVRCGQSDVANSPMWTGDVANNDTVSSLFVFSRLLIFHTKCSFPTRTTVQSSMSPVWTCDYDFSTQSSGHESDGAVRVESELLAGREYVLHYTMCFQAWNSEY